MATKKPAKPNTQPVDDTPLPPHPTAFPDEPPGGAKPPREDPPLVDDKPLPPRTGTPPAPVPSGSPRPPSSSPPPPSGTTDNNQLNKELALSFVESIIDTLTFKRVGLIALLTVIGLVFYVLYENRTNIVDQIVHKNPSTIEDPTVTSWVLSDNSKAALQNLAKTTAVSFIAITDVDLKKNRRVVRYYYIDDPALKLGPEAIRALGLPQAVFDYDAKNTTQMVSILSNEFRCDAYKDTIYFRFAPELESALPTICRMAIPPFVGQFVGFITVGLNTESNKQELDSIRLEVSRIAVDIYLNDVIKKPTAASPSAGKT